MKKSVFSLVLAFFMVLAAVALIPGEQAYADVFSDLGFTTSSEDLENYDERSVSQPYGSNNITISPVAEEYVVEIGTDSAVQRSLAGDNDLGDINSGPLPNNSNKYVKAAALDLNNEGKKHAVAELYYREANNGEIYLTIVDPAVDLNNAASNEILVFSNSTATEPLITDYRNQHTFLNMITGDLDNDGVSEIVVYVPDADNPRLALYKIEDGVIQSVPDQIFSLPGLSKFVYMTAGDITGDNIADLAVSYNGYYNDANDTDLSGHIYIFKSQDFSLSAPHEFKHLPKGIDNGKNYYTSRIINAAVAIGNITGDSDDGQMELVVAGKSGPTKVSRTVLGYRYDNNTGVWDFVEVLSRMDYTHAELFRVAGINENQLTTLACFDFLGKDPHTTKGAYTYIDGIILDELDDIYGADPGSYVGPHYIDYGTVTGNFDANSYNREQLKIIREKVRYDNETGVWNSEGLEIATTTGPAGTENAALSDTVCAALAAPNTDDDTVIMKYKGHDLQYSYPTILAALASPPYFEDLKHLEGGESYVGNSSTEITSGEGSGSETHGNVTVTAGAYVSVEQEVSFFGVKISQAEVEQEFIASYAWDTSHETEISTAITYGTFGGQDSVAVYTIPMDVYIYDVWAPGVGGKGGSWQTMNHCFPYPAAYVVIPAKKYNEIASREEGLPRIGGELFTHTLGRPETYPDSSDEMFKVKDPVVYETPSTVGYGDAYTTQDIEITETHTDSHTFSAELSYRAGAGVAGATVGGVFGIGGGGGWSETSIKNVGYTGTLVNMPQEAEEGGYNYAWQLVAYPYLGEKQNFPVLNYAVTQVRRPPLLPQYFEIQSATNNSITLTWENVDPNVTGYQLYRYYDFEGDLAGYYPIGDLIPLGTNTFTDTSLQPYTYYKYKIQSIGTPYGGHQTASVLGPECKARTNPDSGAPLIVQQPQSVEVAAGSPAVFQIIVQPAPGSSITDRIFYKWQRYVNGKWQLVKDSSDNLWSINSVTEEDAGRYRCAVSQYVGSDPVTVYSHPVELTVNKNNLDVILSFDPDEDCGDINKPITIKAELRDKDLQLSPTGRVNFLFTYYSDPIVTETDEGPQTEYPDPVFTIKEVPVTAGETAQIDWTPAGYGSYDIAAVYLGDDNYHKSSSAVSSFTCVDSAAGSVTGLRITGLKNNTLTYGDKDIKLGATVWQDGSLQNLTADEVDFSSSDAEGLSVVKTAGDNPEWQLTACKAGSYTLSAETQTLKVFKNITVTKAQIGLKVKDQTISQGNAPAPFELETTTGALIAPDTMETCFTVKYRCSAGDESPPGVYDIFINSLTPTSADNYEILSVENGTITITGEEFNIKFRGVSNGTVMAEINNWRVLEENFTTGYDIAAGSRVRFSAIPDTGYRIEKWVVNGTEIMEKDNPDKYDTSTYITTDSLNQDVAVEVYFVPDLCELTYSAGANGTLGAAIGDVTLGSGASLPARTVVSFLAKPNEGYMVNQWAVNNAAISQYARNSYDHTITGDTDVQVFFAPAEYAAVSYTADGNGQVTAENSEGLAVENGSLIIKGSDVVFTAVPNDANSMVKEWVVNGQVVQGSKPVYTAENIQEDLNVEVKFIDAITYTVNFKAIAYGNDALTAEVNGVSISSGDQVKGYSDITFTACPPEGYGVKQWKLGSNVIRDTDGFPFRSKTYVLEELSSSVTVTVEFESTVTYCVDYSVLPDEDGGENGSLSARVTYAGVSSDYGSGDDIRAGSQVELIAVPDNSYRVKEWVVNEKTVTESVYGAVYAVYTIAAIDMDYDISVEFEEGINPLTYAAVGNGSIDADVPSGTTVDDGTSVSFTAEPDQGYQVKEWRYNGDIIEGSNDSCTVTVYNGGYVEVEFEREYYTLTLGGYLSATVNGIDLERDSVQVQGDSMVTVIATPPAGYLLIAWYVDGTLQEDLQGNSYSFTMEQDTEVSADFDQQFYSVAFAADDNGTISATADGSEISSASDQPGGCRLVFTAHPAQGYRVQAWHSGQSVTGCTDETYVIDKLSKPEYIRVYFEEIPSIQEYEVIFSAGSGGSLNAAANGTAISSGESVTEGSRVVFTATPEPGFRVQAWYSDQTLTGSTDETYVIDKLSKSENIQVDFAKIPPVEYEVIFSAGSGGSLNATANGTAISSGELLTEGSRVVFTATPDSGKTVDSWSGAANGTLADNKLTFTIDSLSSDENISVTFKSSITSSPGGGGGGSPVSKPVKSTTGSASVKPDAGGTISLENEASIIIPAGALHGSEKQKLEITKVDTPPAAPSGFMILGQVYQFTIDGADSYSFDKPVTLTFKFDPAKIPAGQTPSVFYYDRISSGWIELNGTLSGNTITVIVDHFTEFTVMLKQKAIIQQDKLGFIDISDHWARESIEELLSLGAASGYPDGTFSPNRIISRAEFASILVKALKLEAQNNTLLFSDTAGHWAKDSIAIAAAHGIVSGYEDSTFKPDDPITREQMAVMAVKASGLSAVSGETAFADGVQISPWALNSVVSAVNNGIMGGYPDNTFKPLGSATRAEAMMVILNLIK